MGTRSDITVLYFLSPRLILIDSSSDKVTIQDLHDTLRDIEDQPANLVYEELISSAGKEDLGDGVLVGLTSTLQNAQIMFERRAVLLESGTVTTGSTGSPVQELIDTSASFVANSVSPGDILLNDTDDSVTEVLEVVDENTLKVFEPAGGADNDFDFGDAYRVFQMTQCEISGGNLVAVDDVGLPISPIFPTFGTQVVRTSSSSATLQEQTEIQHASFDGVVTVDAISSYSGTVYPTGTQRQPVNNIADAVSIGVIRSLSSLSIIGDVTLGSGDDVTSHDITGQSTVLTTITINAAAVTTNAEFRSCTLTGTLDNGVIVRNSILSSITYFNGIVFNSILSGTITLGGGLATNMLNCYCNTGVPTINLGGSGQALYVRGFNGCLKLENKTGADDVELDLVSGHVTLAPTVSNGTITARGVGKLTDESDNHIRSGNFGGATIVNELVSSDEFVATLDDNTYDSKSFADIVGDLLSMATGRIVESPAGTYTFYEQDNITTRFVLVKSGSTRSRV